MQAAIESSGWYQLGMIVGLFVLGIMNVWNASKAVKASNAAAKIARDTHTLVNSNFGVQLRKSMMQSRRIADMTTDPIAKAEAIKTAEEDQKLYEDHIARQAVVDAANALLDKAVAPKTPPP